MANNHLNNFSVVFIQQHYINHSEIDKISPYFIIIIIIMYLCVAQMCKINIEQNKFTKKVHENLL